MRMYRGPNWLVVLDDEGEQPRMAVSTDDGIDDLWRDPDRFMMANAMGYVIWTDDPCTEARSVNVQALAAEIAQGTLIWQTKEGRLL